jgi:hypothetical protein
MPVFAVLVGGSAFVGYIEPQPPLYGLLVLPAAPLALALVAWLPWVRSGGIRALAIEATATVLVLVAGLAIAMLESRQLEEPAPAEIAWDE